MDAKKVLGGSVIVVLGLLLDKLITFGSRVVLARYFEAAGFGTVGLARTSITVLGIAALLGLNTGISRYLPQQTEDEQRSILVLNVVQILVVTSLIASFVGVGLALVLGPRLSDSPNGVTVMFAAAAIVPIYAVYRLAIGTLRGMEMILPKVYSENILRPLVNIGGFVVIVIYGFSEIEALYVLLLGFLLPVAYIFVMVNRRIDLLKNVVSAGTAARRSVPTKRELVGFSAPLTVSAFSYRLLSDVDKLLLGFLIGAASPVGTYEAIYPLSRLQMLTLSGLSFTILPALSGEGRGVADDSRSIYRLGTKWVVAASLPVFLSLLFHPDFLIGVTFGTKYVAGAASLQILCIGYFSHVVAGPNGSALAALGYTRTLMIDNALIAGLNIFLNLLLIPRYGLLGAVTATTISFAGLNLLRGYQLYHLESILPSLRGPTIATVTLGLTYYLVFSYTLDASGSAFGRFLLTTILFTPVYVLATIRIFVNRTEVEMLESTLEEYDCHAELTLKILRKLAGV